MSAKVVKIAVSLPMEDFKVLEIIRKKMGVTRSALVDKAIRYWFDKRKEEEMIRRYEEGYKRKPESMDDIIAWEKAGLEAWNKEEEWQ